MALQVVLVNDASPGALVDAGITSDETDLTSTLGWAGTTGTFSSTLDVTGNATFGGTVAITGATTFTGAVTANGGITLGAGDDLIGSSTSDITINSDKFTVAGATGNTVVAGTLAVGGATTQTGALGCAASITLGAGADLIGSSTSDITIATDKFTVAGATGNTVVAGTLTLGSTVGAAGTITLGAGADLVGSTTSDITIATDKFTVAGASGNTAVGGTLGVTGITTHSAAVGFGGSVVAAAHGAYAIPLTTMVTNVSTDADSDLAATLADGQAGQLKVVVLDTDGGNDVVITPAHFGSGSTVTMDAANDYAVFVFDGVEWWVISTSGTVG